MKQWFLSVNKVFLMAAMLGGGNAVADDHTGKEATTSSDLEDYTEKIEAHLLEFEMKAIPRGTVEVPDPTESGETIKKEVGPFWIGKTPITWDVYGIFAFAIDVESDKEFDAATRPTFARLDDEFPLDRGWGWGKRPAIGMTPMGARQFVKWLSEKTGRKYRLATEAEWIYACRAGKESLEKDPETLAQHAWFKANAEGKTHPVGQLKPNAFGLHDMIGNVAEWVEGIDGEPVVLGGSYRTPAEDLSCTYRQKESPFWDINFPQEPWWYPEGPFVGFRVVHDPSDQQDTEE